MSSQVHTVIYDWLKSKDGVPEGLQDESYLIELDVQADELTKRLQPHLKPIVQHKD
jgi:hypothetical protein